ncbi:MAG: 4-hydroxy-tetrahydrodipicolinate reductase [Lachnospiraceae bacterium]|nr:4-hydroxy-tetrahydrodipicolinate reductase [Lachnospiraceae bacterium]
MSDKVRIVLGGCNGRMGHVVRQIAGEDDRAEIAAGIDLCSGDADFPVFAKASDCDVDCDVMIDFSSPAALTDLLDFAVRTGTPAVLCATGYSKEQLEEIGEASKKVAILRSANMSLGVNTIARLVKEAAKLLAGEGYDIDIVERHHRHKADAPSGTALLLADAANSGIRETVGETYEYCYDRTGRRMERPVAEIGISSVRGGSIVGDHEVIFAGLDEVVEIRHSAYSKAVFAKGAVKAAKFLKGKPAGMYGMSEVI